MDPKLLDTFRLTHKSELEAYLDRVWANFLVFCRVADRKKKPGQDVHAQWSPPLPHPFGGQVDILLEPLLKERMQRAGFLNCSVLSAGFLSVFWQAGSVPPK